MKSRVIVVAGILTIASTLVVLAGQTPAFDVVSIRPNKSGERSSSARLSPGGRYTVTNATAFSLILSAYEMRRLQVVGGPAWLQSDRFDIAANAEPPLTSVRMDAMRRRLLAERFGLQVHHETREMSVLALVMARSDGRRGPKLQEASAEDADCGRTQGPVLDGPPVTSCGTAIGGSANVRHAWLRGLTMDKVAQFIESRLGEAVVLNRTGLTGAFNAALEWSSELEPQAASASFGTALREQLGLRLTSVKAPVDVLVIDHAERPTEN